MTFWTFNVIINCSLENNMMIIINFDLWYVKRIVLHDQNLTSATSVLQLSTIFKYYYRKDAFAIIMTVYFSTSFTVLELIFNIYRYLQYIILFWYCFQFLIFILCYLVNYIFLDRYFLYTRRLYGEITNYFLVLLLYYLKNYFYAYLYLHQHVICIHSISISWFYFPMLEKTVSK